VSKICSRILGEDIRNIPLHLLSGLSQIGITAYEYEYDNGNVFEECEVDRFLYSQYKSDEGAEAALIEKLEAAKEPISAFLSNAKLDHILHKYGKGTPEYYDEVKVVDERLNRVWNCLKSRNNNPEMLLISDHGMENVTHFYRFDIEEVFENANRDYHYFVDATMVRIWCKDLRLTSKIISWIQSLDFAGRILEPSERKLWGIDNEGFGEVIYLLDPGFMFAPNFFGDKGCKAMHGYWPTHESQQGVIASTTRGFEDGIVVPALTSYKIFRKFFGFAKKE
jgi:predicted AlkP superfamily pyrophosphatase or phosphodiesterase